MFSLELLNKHIDECRQCVEAGKEAPEWLWTQVIELNGIRNKLARKLDNEDIDGRIGSFVSTIANAKKWKVKLCQRNSSALRHGDRTLRFGRKLKNSVRSKFNKARHGDGYSVAASPSSLQSRACWWRYVSRRVLI